MAQKAERVALSKLAPDGNHPGSWILSTFSFGAGPVDLVLSEQEMGKLVRLVQNSYLDGLPRADAVSYPSVNVSDVNIAHGEGGSALLLTTNVGDIAMMVDAEIRPKLKNEIDRLDESDKNRSRPFQ